MFEAERKIIGNIDVAARNKYAQIQKIADVKARVAERSTQISALKGIFNSPNKVVRMLAPGMLAPIIKLFETQQAADLRQATAQKAQDDENAQLQSYKTKLTNSVNEILAIESDFDKSFRLFQLSKTNRDEIATIPEPKKTKVLNIANPILTPVEDKFVAIQKVFILDRVKNIDKLNDENAKKQERTQLISDLNNNITQVHEPIKSKAKAISSRNK